MWPRRIVVGASRVALALASGCAVVSGLNAIEFGVPDASVKDATVDVVADSPQAPPDVNVPNLDAGPSPSALFCGQVTCSFEKEYCCYRGRDASACRPQISAPCEAGAIELKCDYGGHCGDASVCCSKLNGGNPSGASCEARDDCKKMNGFVLCRSDNECVGGAKCVPAFGYAVCF
ncbi:hypothetical protein BH09MYX1_BH09MYX1_38030 [soil metagenome]